MYFSPLNIQSEKVGSILKEQEKSGRLIAAICAGKFIMCWKHGLAFKPDF